ncbi:hypothetical protein M378DRAFT_168484 [Amanita muscaria Koide BX008]|uniref:Uncharacterized protein n=1 Tax=Amanita muscaria (strain Koide BX008) TaxID=946122 RepID=A0A0C2WUQ8_AMAMK|nr:hypothetical protein M378DRAFT_168484 [Amanita muscaria Koide BX008]
MNRGREAVDPGDPLIPTEASTIRILPQLVAMPPFFTSAIANLQRLKGIWYVGSVHADL